MALTFRDEKGTPLLKEEADANIRDLDDRITVLQSGGPGITKTGTPADNQIAVWTGANSLEGTTALTLSADLLSATWVNSGAVAGPNLRLHRESASPAPNDNLGEVRFEGKNSNNEVIVYARIHTEAAVVTDAQEAGRLIIQLPLTVASVVAYRDLLKLGPTAEMALVSEDTAAAVGPVLVLDRTSTSPAAADNLGQVTFRGRDSTNAPVDYATIKGTIANATDTAETGSLEVQVIRAGPSPAILQVTTNGVEVPNGILKLPSGTTVQRPPANSVPAGSSFYDTSFSIPVWSNGSIWATAEGLKPFGSATGNVSTNPSGGSWKLTGNVTNVQVTNGWNALYLNVAGAGINRTITPASGTCIVIETGATAASVTVANNKAVTVIGDGTNLIVFGDVV